MTLFLPFSFSSDKFSYLKKTRWVWLTHWDNTLRALNVVKWLKNWLSCRFYFHKSFLGGAHSGTSLTYTAWEHGTKIETSSMLRNVTLRCPGSSCLRNSQFNFSLGWACWGGSRREQSECVRMRTSLWGERKSATRMTHWSDFQPESSNWWKM